MPSRDIHVAVVARYLPEHSDPAESRYAFGYTITLTNRGSAAAKLLRRHWVITDGNQKVQEVRGDGVVGQQPRLTPGQSHQYSSGALLETRVGSMQGEYTFVDDEGNEFEVPIPVFSLADPGALN